jgi:hypothetical protein
VDLNYGIHYTFHKKPLVCAQKTENPGKVAWV